MAASSVPTPPEVRLGPGRSYSGRQPQLAKVSVAAPASSKRRRPTRRQSSDFPLSPNRFMRVPAGGLGDLLSQPTAACHLGGGRCWSKHDEVGRHMLSREFLRRGALMLLAAGAAAVT